MRNAIAITGPYGQRGPVSGSVMGTSARAVSIGVGVKPKVRPTSRCRRSRVVGRADDGANVTTTHRGAGGGVNVTVRENLICCASP